MPPPDPLAVVISAREIYDEIVGMRDDVRTLTQTNVTVHTQLTDHEERLRGLERWKYGLPIAAFSGALATGAALFSSMRK
ncbi:hypothetical protein P3T36_002987 [Kitasatospora sp. MAP12-15]|uniref:hypothetical protein n=1 Tax=unclassified Kitasatospora TaxID=2633591 RepID=UPI002473CFEC|nr:hypothetical protein [Kitasatospora sp. MAP12-44]MDH6108856.1 hypothetical protein [Kitasatospora sp. MAP12-44]